MGVKSSLYYRRGAGGKVAIEDQSVSPGDRYFVHAGTGTDGTAYGFTPDKPFATIDYAISQCTASKGDIVYVMPGHAENITTAIGIAADVIGVQIIGIGEGALIPTVSFTAAAGSVTVSVASVVFKNIKFVANFETGVTTGFTIAAGADNLTLDGLVFRDTSATFEFLIHLSVATTVDDLTIKNCNFITAAGTMSSSVMFAGTTANLLIENNFWFCDCSASVIDHLTGVPTACAILNNRAVNVDTTAGLCVGLKSDGVATGLIDGNYLFGNLGTSEPLAATNDYVMGINYVCNTLQASGVLNPAAGAVP